jgi:tetratricopeptide (TPR) repeat protein
VTPERYRRVVALFEEAAPLAPAGRAALLAQACGEDAELRRAVEAMLEQDARRSLLHTGAGAAPARLAARLLEESAAPGAGAAPVPERIGPYRILGVLGAGAMGTVYRAEQQSPRREVALKTIHWWVLSPQAVERFRFEAQALAQLQHPGIPQVYAVSEDAEGVCFAMELVEGVPLREHASRLAGDVRGTLALLAEVADAVHHAHLRGLVHRDLKPDNLRVTPSGQPKVLDFGISLPVDVTGAAAAGVREVSGTLAYMSPEQLSPEGGIDIRADVYALGVIAYELLAGERPLRLEGLTLAEARERVRQGGVVPLGRRRAALRGDVEHIVARAMAPAREGRYGSAAELAEDLRRALRHEPVRAHPGGAGYRLGRLLRRHRLAAAAALALFLALSGGGATSFVLYRRAEAARAAEAQLREVAQGETERARREADKSAATVGFLEELLLQADPNRSLGKELSVREALDRAAERLAKGSLASQPEVEAAVRLTLGRAYQGLGAEEAAASQVLAAARLEEGGLLPQSEEASRALLALASLHERRGDFPEAREALSRLLARERALHPAGPHAHVVSALSVAGKVARESGDFPAGEAHFRAALADARALSAAGALPSEGLGEALRQLAVLLMQVGRYREAEGLLREGLALAEGCDGLEHPSVAAALHDLAYLYKEEERGAEARPLLARALAIRQRVFGPRHPQVAAVMTLQWAVAMDLGELGEAERLMEASMGILTGVYGPDAPQVTRENNGVARLRLLQGRYAEARDLAAATVVQHRKRYGDFHWVAGGATSLMAQALTGLGEHETAITLLRQVVATQQSQLGPHARGTRRALAALARAEAAAQKAAAQRDGPAKAQAAAAP